MRLALVALPFALVVAALGQPAHASPVSYGCTFVSAAIEGDWPATLTASFDTDAQVVNIDAGGERFHFAADRRAGYVFSLAAADGGYFAEGVGPDFLHHFVILSAGRELTWSASDRSSEVASTWSCSPA